MVIRRGMWLALVVSFAITGAATAIPSSVEQVVQEAESTYRGLGMSLDPDMANPWQARWWTPPPGEVNDWRGWLDQHYPGGWDRYYHRWNYGSDPTRPDESPAGCHATAGWLSQVAALSPSMRPWVGDPRLTLHPSPCDLLEEFTRASSGAGVCPDLPLSNSCAWYRAAMSGGGLHRRCNDTAVVAAVNELCGAVEPGDGGGEGEDGDDEEEPPPPPADCECDLSLTNAQIVRLGERLLAAADARAALERAHDLRLDELERTAEELRQAWEELREDDEEPEPPPPPGCQTPAEREATLEAWALRNRNPAMVARGDSGARVLEIIRGNPTSHLARALAAHEETLPPVCEAGNGGDQGEGDDVAEIAWPDLLNHHAETVERYRLHAWVLHGVLPPHVAMSSKRAANTPNQRFLRAVDLYLTTGEASDLLAELATRHTTIMITEQGDYRLYHPEAAQVAALVAQARGGDLVEAEAKAWLASYCAYADLISVAGVSRIPGPRIGAAYGKDAWRDETCRILSGSAPPRGGGWEILAPDAARHLASRLRGQVTWSRDDLPGVLSPLTVQVHRRGVIAEVDELVKAAGGPVWATAADTTGREAMVSWRDAGATHWSCKDVQGHCVAAKRWSGRPLEAPVDLDISSLQLGTLVEEWRLDVDGARRVQ